MENKYYKPSGKFSVSFIFLSLLFMTVAIPVTSIVYVYLVHYITMIYVNFFFTCLCGIALGFVINYATIKGKARNAKVVFICTVAAACFAYYVQWCVYIPLVYSDKFNAVDLTFGGQLLMALELLIDPEAVYEMASVVNRIGVWSIVTGSSASSKPIEVRGIFLLIVWISELVILNVTAYMASKNKPKFPFSEEANEWYKEMPTKIKTSVPENFDAMKKEMEKGNFDELAQLAKNMNENDLDSLSLSFFQPPTLIYSKDLHYMSITKHTIKRDKKGKEKKNEKKEKVLVEYISIDNESVKKLTQK